MPIAQAYNVDFQLHTLGWKAFQDLCATVTAEVLGQDVQQFLPTKDAGRDGAFAGQWNGKRAERFVVQCKFFGAPGKILRLSHLKDEIPKARRLAKKGLCDRYLLLTNGVVTGPNAATIEAAFTKRGGPKVTVLFGADWLTEKIRSSPRLRALVPRIYGLGDLSQIIDQRALDQARELLSSIQDELGKFVITRSYQQAANASMDKGFVFLLGEPACGKSMAAACLSVAALDREHHQVFKLTRASEFHQHWDPHERRLFWFDDVFGPTQYERDLALEWVRYFPELNAAVRAGSSVIFTSRSYIYDAAIKDIKTSAFPLLRNSQVVIKVEDVSPEERAQILYNHLKLGSQPQRFRTRIKPLLAQVAASPGFQPEIARRLGNPEFTRSLGYEWSDVQEFVEHPKAFLVEVIESLDAANFGALTLLFLNGGRVQTPLHLSKLDRGALQRLGVSEADVAKALNSMKASLTKLVIEAGEQVWRFKHPTIADAIAEVVSRNPEYVEIYLRGAKPEECLREVVVGDIQLEGAKLHVGKQGYKRLVEMLSKVDTETRNNFLSRRCDAQFLKKYLEHVAATELVPWHGYLYAVSGSYVMARLHELGILPEDARQKYLKLAEELASSIYDFGFFNTKHVRSVFTNDEVYGIVRRFAEEFLPNAEQRIEAWGEDRGDSTPSDHFDYIRDALRAVSSVLKSEFENEITEAEATLETAIDTAEENDPAPWERRSEDSDHLQQQAEASAAGRDIFDDIDE